MNALVRDLRKRDIRTKSRLLATGVTRGGVPFGRGSLFYLLRNRFYIGEVKYKDETLPGEQPAIMDRALFDAVQQKLTDQWTTRSKTRNASDHLLTGLLFDDAGHRMVPTHATKAGVRYRYYVSLPHLHGESKTASVGSISRLPATDIEDTVVNSLNERLIVKQKNSNSSIARVDRGRSRHRGDPGRFLSRTASPKVKSAQRGSNVARASLAPSPEVVAGLTKSFRARSLTSSRSQHVKSAACVRST